MNQKSVLKLIKQYQWRKFLTRHYTPLFISVHINDYYQKLKTLIGETYKNFIYLSKQGFTDIYRDTISIKKVEEKFYHILKKDHKKVDQLIRESEKALRKIKQYSSKKKIRKPITFLAFQKNLDLYSWLFGRITILPYYLGMVAEKRLNLQNLYFKKMIKKLEKFRLTDYYGTFENYAIKPYLKKFAKENNLPIELVEQLTFLELSKIVHKQRNINRQELIKRKKYFVYTFFDGKESVISNKNFVAKIDKLINPKTKIKGNIIKGIASQPGKITGKVILVQNISDLKKFKKNNILVSTSTNPNLMPALKKAVAIITDEGGLTSHAAIISRELKIPCVIGTKIATQVLKDGDKVEVDADKGMIKKINNS
ncbi:hypothetical protein KKF32_02480 [Patescibacteria group bacterium]|nr:hypothetical protein [Patescibacteria group bacterium]